MATTAQAEDTGWKAADLVETGGQKEHEVGVVTFAQVTEFVIN